MDGITLKHFHMCHKPEDNQYIKNTFICSIPFLCINNKINPLTQLLSFGPLVTFLCFLLWAKKGKLSILRDNTYYFLFSVCFKMPISLPSLIFFSLCMCVFVESLSLWHGSVASIKLSSDLLCALFQCFVLGCAFMFTPLVV